MTLWSTQNYTSISRIKTHCFLPLPHSSPSHLYYPIYTSSLLPPSFPCFILLPYAPPSSLPYLPYFPPNPPYPPTPLLPLTTPLQQTITQYQRPIRAHLHLHLPPPSNPLLIKPHQPHQLTTEQTDRHTFISLTGYLTRHVGLGWINPLLPSLLPSVRSI